MYEHDFCEYAVEKKKEGAYLAKMILATVLATAAVIAVLVLLMPYEVSFGLIALAAVGALVWYLSRYTFIEYEYSQTGATLDFAAVYSKQYRREILSIDLKKSARRIAPYTDGNFGDGFRPKKVTDLRSAKQTPNAYAVIYEEENGQSAVLFDANKRIVENIWHQVPSVTVRSDTLPEA
jgi:hypothetical protein